MKFGPVAHFSGVNLAGVSLVERMPWLYIVVCFGSKIVYVGETNEGGGLVGRLSKHFGPFVNSTLRQRAQEVASLGFIRGPFLTIAAPLPTDEEGLGLDASSKQVRLAFETQVHEKLGKRFIPDHGDWTIVSTPQSSKINETPELIDLADSVFDCYDSSFRVFETLSSEATPYQLILLDRVKSSTAERETREIGELITDIEQRLFQWILGKLKVKYGDKWWVEGVPQPIRVECAKRREEELAETDLPLEAYLDLIDARAVLRSNWGLLGSELTRLSGEQSKDKATKWIVDLNSARKIWAHPVKRLFCDIDKVKEQQVRYLHQRVDDVLVVGNSIAARQNS